MPTVIWVQGGEHLEDPGIHIHSEKQLDTILKEKDKDQIIYVHVL